MTLLFIVMVLAVFAGGVCLWVSGLFFGRRARPRSGIAADAAARDGAERAQLERHLAAAAERIESVEAGARRAEESRSRAEADVARAAAELERVAGEMARAEAEIARLKAENEGLKQAPKPHRLKPPTPTRIGTGEPRPDAPDNEDLDLALAQLDMERVAHQKTRDELDQVKRASVAPPIQLSDGRPSALPPAPGMGVPGRRGAGFQTVSIAARGQPVSGADHDRLRQVNEQLQREKERVEAELSRAQQELQLLRMRG